MKPADRPGHDAPLCPEQQKMHDWIKRRVQEEKDRQARGPTWAEYLLPIVMAEEQPTERERRPMQAMKNVPVGVHSSDVVQLLRQQGRQIGIWRLRHAASRGYIPRPFKTAAGDHCWRADDLPAIADYFDDPVKPGRKKHAP